MADNAHLSRLNPIQISIDARQFRAIGRKEIGTTRIACHVPQGDLIKFLLAYGRWIPNGHRMDPYIPFAGHARCFGWRYLTGGVIAIGQRDDRFRGSVTGIEQ